jgi:hypothetical protein
MRNVSVTALSPGERYREDVNHVLAVLQETIEANYRTEIGKEENSWRTIPFFTATIAFQFTLLAGLTSYIPGLSPYLKLPAWMAFATVAGTNVLVCWKLLRMVRPRVFRYIPPESEIVEHVVRLSQRRSLANTEMLYRKYLINRLSEAVEHNRAINTDRANRRSEAAYWLVMSLLLSVLLAAAIMFVSYGLGVAAT